MQVVLSGDSAMRIRTAVMFAALAAASWAAPVGTLVAQEAGGRAAAPAPAAKPVVEIAILLDTSNSMDGLIEQAKSQLWKIVNEFAKAQRGGARPDLRVALYQYGTPALGADTGYTRQLVPLTDDLDKVSAELFKLTTNGGDEYCGTVIQKAATDLQWSTAKDAYRAIFIAGNEPFTQGSVDYHTACKEAIAKGILVNTIFCGTDEEGARTGWKDGAALADGSYMSINQNAQVAHVAAPQDKELADLSSKINGTYVYYGQQGAQGAANQAAQDLNARGAGRGGRGGGGALPAATPAAAERAVTKAGAAYRNSTWDLVDAVKDKKVDLKQIKDEELPPEMKGMDPKAREAFVAAKQKERADIQARIQQLGAERDKFLADQKQQAGDATLDAAIISTVRTQAKNSGMTFQDAGK
jgi:hypothetical protein